MDDGQGTFDFGGPKEPKFTKGKMVVKLFPDHFTSNGVPFKRPPGMDDEPLLEACQPNNKCCRCVQTSGINFSMSMGSPMLVGLYNLYHYQKKHGGFEKYVTTNEMVENESRSFGANVRSVVSKLKHFDVLEKLQGPRPSDGMATKKGSGKTGFYRMTERGRAFVENRLAIQTVCAVYNDENLNCYGKKELVSELKLDKFNWKEAFYGAPPKT